MSRARVASDDFRGARGSNTGDDFHELWATRHAIRLLSGEDGLAAIALEGLAAADESGEPKGSWDGVDCTLYHGGVDAGAADVTIEQLKYSAANPQAPWTVARLVAGKRREASVLAKLAKAFSTLNSKRAGLSPPRVVLISNQPIDPTVIDAFSRAAAHPIERPSTRPASSAANELRLAYAAGLTAAEFQSFATALRFDGGVGSRFLMEEAVLRSISEWTDLELQQTVATLRQFVRNRMRPEAAGEVVTRESVMLQFGSSVEYALFPCPSEISIATDPVRRTQIDAAAKSLLGSVRHMCLHGHGSVGKTTALQEIETALPPGSIMIKYDCYGGGRYLDTNAFRHRTADAFAQLTNELAAVTRLPLLVGRNPGTDWPRAFSVRLARAAEAIETVTPGALLVIAVDAADNAIVAAQTRSPPEPSFVQDFVGLNSQAQNVRFLATARTGRLSELNLPRHFQQVAIHAFTLDETRQNVARTWNAPGAWVDDFHHLSGGNPRVQAYAFNASPGEPAAALERLRPNGKSLDEVFRQQFNAATTKGGAVGEVSRLCAGLVVLPRPVPLTDLAAVLGASEAKLTDICSDLAPGIRLRDGNAGFADEDFEDFVRREAQTALGEVRQSAANWLLPRAHTDEYAALHVAPVLVAAGYGRELLDLVEKEPSPQAVKDPVLRRVAEVQRLRLAIRVCREADDPALALRFVLIGGEAIHTDRALRKLLLDNPDMAARFAHDSASRLILGDPRQIANHGRLLFQRLSVDAERNDAIAVREGWRRLRAWMQARKEPRDEDVYPQNVWAIKPEDIASDIDAVLRMGGPTAALQHLATWTPRRISLQVARILVPRIIAEGRASIIESLVGDQELDEAWALFLLCPLALSGRPIDTALLARSLASLARRKLNVGRFFRQYQESGGLHEYVLQIVLTACELLTIRGEADCLVDDVLKTLLVGDIRRIDLRHSHDSAGLNILFRAFTLSEVRAGRTPTADAVFLPRPESPASNRRQRYQDSTDAERHDRPLRELTSAVFGIYAAAAAALVSTVSVADALSGVRQAATALAGEEWRLSRQYGSRALRMRVAEGMLVLLAKGCDPHALMASVETAHGNWRSGADPLDPLVVGTLALRGELHDRLLQDLISTASACRALRIGAREKSERLVTFAKLIMPISPIDANAVFNSAVEVASELDSEIAFQLSFLNRLVGRGMSEFAGPRIAAEGLTDVIHDAAVRLASNDDFPWDAAMSALTTLDPPAAMAAASRWVDTGTAPLADTLPPIVRRSLATGVMTPGVAAALDLFLERDHDLMRDACEAAIGRAGPVFQNIREEAAWDSLVRYGHQRNLDLVTLLERHGALGKWSDRAVRQHHFVNGLFSKSEDTPRTSEDEVMDQAWDVAALVDSTALASEIASRKAQAKAEKRYVPIATMLSAARRLVAPRHRIEHLRALADLILDGDPDAAVDAVMEAIEDWRQYPAVSSWCTDNLPELIVRHLPHLARYSAHGDDKLERVLTLTGLGDHGLQDLILRGLEAHVDNMSAGLVFALAGIIATKLPAGDAAKLAKWYIARLVARVPQEVRDHPSRDDLPSSVTSAAARFVFAFLSDVDLRMRWRGAHALRRLARLGEVATVDAAVDCYDRSEETAFRARSAPFYWLAARLWFVIAWDRVSGERPEVAAHHGQLFLRIALSDDLPHVLIRAFARDVCEKLRAHGCLTLDEPQAKALAAANVSQLPRAPSNTRNKLGYGQSRDNERFRFNSMDTLPYWYDPMVRCFAAVSGKTFLHTAEHWIVDVWGCKDDTSSYRNEPRSARFTEGTWRLSSNDHGSLPTLERFHTYLEWHGMWCATGQLLQTEALPERDDHYDWERLDGRIADKKLGEPPLWAADLLCPIPLEPGNWVSSTQPFAEWLADVHEGSFRGQLLPTSSPDYAVVDASIELRSSDRLESFHVSSALVSPKTAPALLRALQTMDDSWDYKIPEESEDSHEIDDEPYRLLGWLVHSHHGSGIDEKDPLRKHASVITVAPGSRVQRAVDLRRVSGGSAAWFAAGADTAMFVYEVWGDSERDEDRYSSNLQVSGRRLLVHREQLAAYLERESLNLLVEVEVTRRDRQTRYHFDEEKIEEKEARYDRLYLLRSDGALDIAEGCAGAWAPDRR